MASVDHGAMQTRSGQKLRTIRPSVERGCKVTKTTKAPKVKKEKIKAEKKMAKLTEPLSILTRAWDHVPVVDIDAYVNRSAEIRRKEVEDGKVPGKVKRPMNSFMLYRKAYQSRTKEFCLQNNHQVVSQVCGDSWPLEPEDTREQFNEWARIERANHQNAHPGYKFSPSKPGKAKKDQKRQVSEEPDSEESDLDDYDYRTGRSTRRSRKYGRPERLDPDDTYHPSSQSQGYVSRESSMAPDGIRALNHHPSSYQANNPGRPPPIQYTSQPGQGHYYQQIVHQGPLDGIEDIKMMLHHGPTSQYVLPSSDYQQAQQFQQHGLPAQDLNVDVSLFDYPFQQDDLAHTESSTRLYGHGQGFMNPNNLLLHHQPLQYEPLESRDQKFEILKGHREDWNVSALDPALEFDLFTENRR